MQQRQHELEQQDERIRDKAARIKHKIMVLSGKGGVGKSTVAANLAWALAEQDSQVGLMDADLHGPTIPLMTGLAGQVAVSSDQAIQPVDLTPNLGVMSIGFMIPEPDTPTIWRGPLRANVLRQFIADVEWGALDFLVVDLPPGTGDEPLTIAQALEDADGGIIVTTPQEASLSDCRKAINFLRKVGHNVLGVIENMSGFVCPHCGERTDIFSAGGGELMAEQMDVPFLGRVPIVAEIVALSDEGKPLLGPDSPQPVREAFEAIVQALLAELADA